MVNNIFEIKFKDLTIEAQQALAKFVAENCISGTGENMNGDSSIAIVTSEDLDLIGLKGLYRSWD